MGVGTLLLVSLDEALRQMGLHVPKARGQRDVLVLATLPLSRPGKRLPTNLTPPVMNTAQIATENTKANKR
jgi:hypothetical protein